MFHKRFNEVSAFIAGDKTIIKELLHPKNDADVSDSNYSLAYAEVLIGEASLPHILHQSSELYYILQGEGLLFIDEESVLLEKNDFALVPKGANQWIKNTGNQALQFLVIVSPPWNEGQEEVF